jgi:hypothetical protein
MARTKNPSHSPFGHVSLWFIAFALDDDAQSFDVNLDFKLASFIEFFCALWKFALLVFV